MYVTNDYGYRLPQKKFLVFSDITYKFIAYTMSIANAILASVIMLRIVSIECYTIQSFVSAYFMLFLLLMPIFILCSSLASVRKHIKKRFLSVMPILIKDVFLAWTASAIGILKTSLIYVAASFFSAYVLAIVVVLIGVFTIIKIFKEGMKIDGI